MSPPAGWDKVLLIRFPTLIRSKYRFLSGLFRICADVRLPDRREDKLIDAENHEFGLMQSGFGAGL
jgi:hypothetical protein